MGFIMTPEEPCRSTRALPQAPGEISPLPSGESPPPSLRLPHDHPRKKRYTRFRFRGRFDFRELLYFAFQLKFAAITPALIIGAFAERIRFKSLMIYIVAWTTFVYVPIAHWNWGIGGWLKSLGVIDFAGGLVVHTAAGVSAVAAALVIGRREGIGRLDSRPNNIPYVILGASVPWFGWVGFNAGGALAPNGLALNPLGRHK